MKNIEEWIKEEEHIQEEINNQIGELDKRWFKTSRTFVLIKFLKEYLKIKEKFIDELKQKGGK